MIDDAEELGRVHVQVWREAYAGLMPQESLDRLDPVRRGARWRERAEAAEQETVSEPTTQVAHHVPSGAVVGFATVAPGRDDDTPTPWELWAINVLAAHHGTGVADQLLADTLGERAAYLWVLQGNERAIAFYRKHGFALDGVTKRDEHLGVDELRMVRGSAT